jgi:hypothetical protein
VPKATADGPHAKRTTNVIQDAVRAWLPAVVYYGLLLLLWVLHRTKP